MPIQQMFLRSYGPAVDPGYAINFDGSDNLSLSSTADLNPENGVFTLEFWLKPATWNNSAYNTVWHNYAVNGLYLGKDNSDNFVVRSSNNTSYINATELPPIGKWTHVAAVRDGSTLYLFYNGALQESVSNSFNFATAATFISSTGGPGEYYTGRISNLRFVKGTALYTSAFTPPSSPLTSVTNTKLLCCNSDTTTGATTTPGTITAGGDPAVETGPFSFDVAGKYSVGFDGSGDYLSIADNDAWYIETDYTAECWFNCDALTGAGWDAIFGQWQSNGANATNGWVLEYVGNNLDFYYMNSNGSLSYKTVGTPALQTWHHFAISKSGSTTRLFLNGSEGVSSFDMGAQQNGTGIFTVGGYVAGGGYFNGRVSNVRITKGQALYTSNFTPSTTPLTTTSQSATASNVKLLCCNTNTPTGSTVTPSTITANGDAVATADCPFS
tara:strand:+ start:375 stop:1697 length:1323 start_codon:yes stop_codon:yes gene_type:complete